MIGRGSHRRAPPQHPRLSKAIESKRSPKLKKTSSRWQVGHRCISRAYRPKIGAASEIVKAVFEQRVPSSSFPT